jgi:hypothetical protein
VRNKDKGPPRRPPSWTGAARGPPGRSPAPNRDLPPLNDAGDRGRNVTRRRLGGTRAAAPSIVGGETPWRRPYPISEKPRVAKIPKATPHKMIEIICHMMTAFLDAPKETIAAEVI